MSVIKYLSHPSKGCNRKLLLHLYKSLIRSRLDYGSPIYNLASKSALKLLDPIQTYSLRLALGAFCTSPRVSLCAEAAEPPLSYRRLILTSNFMISVAQLPDLPAYNTIFCPNNNLHLLSKNKQIRPKFEETLKKPFSPLPLLPIHSLSPPWTLPRPPIRLDLTQTAPTNKTVYLHGIRQLLNEFPDHTVCLTDGSKSKNGTAYAYSIKGEIVAHRIHNIASIFTAELMAILACLSDLTQLPPNSKYILLTDSLASLQSLTDPYHPNPLIQKIFITLSALNTDKTAVTFVWIPGHIDFPEHDAVDLAAKQATCLPSITYKSDLPAADYKNYYRHLILKNWQNSWQNETSNKLRTIKKDPVPWATSARESRREEVILARLRIGHTRITHSHLINPYSFSPPSCLYCHEDCFTAEHIFTCPTLHPLRSSLQVPSSISSALKNNPVTVSASIQYLQHTQFYSLL